MTLASAPPMPSERRGEAEATAADMQAAVDRIVRTLDDARIPYCLLRNRDRIPDGLLHWTDLDLLVPAGITPRRLASVFSALRPAQIVEARPGLSVISFPVANLFLRVDICSGDLDWRGASFVRARDILADRWNDNGIMVASELHQAYVTWISKLIWSGFYAPRYSDIICHSAREYPVVLYDLLDEAFGSALATRLLTLAQADQLPASEQFVPELRRSLWNRAIRRQPLAIARSMARQATSRGRSIASPPGIVVAITGPSTATRTAVCTHLAHLPARQLPCGRVDHLTTTDQTPTAMTRVSARNPRILSKTAESLERWMNYGGVRRSLIRGRLVLDDRKPATGSSIPAPADLHLFFNNEPTTTRHACSSQTRTGERKHHIDASRPSEDIVEDVKQLIIDTYVERTRQRFPEISP